MKNRLIFVKIVSIALFMALGMSPAMAADWEFIGRTDAESYYYDAESLTHPAEDIIRLWGKIIRHTEGGGERTNLMEINCAQKEFRILQSIDYDKKGKVTEKSSSPTSWDVIAPDSPCELMYEDLCI